MKHAAYNYAVHRKHKHITIGRVDIQMLDSLTDLFSSFYIFSFFLYLKSIHVFGITQLN